MATAALPRPNEKIAILSFVLVFLCGVVLGAVVMSFLGHGTMHGAPPVSTGLSMSVREWKDQLDLTDQQTVQLTSVLDDFSHYYDNVLADGQTRIMQILNPEQQRKFEQMLRNHKSSQPGSVQK
jgi:Spy/CpxP family protein refolding chaperone